jgi:hypothetical protein
VKNLNQPIDEEALSLGDLDVMDVVAFPLEHSRQSFP